MSATVSPDGLVTKNQETWALATDPYVGSNNGMIVAVTETYIQICMNKQGLSYEVEPYSTSQGTSIVASGGGRLLFNEKIAAKYGYSGLFIIEGVGVRAALGVLWPGRGRGLPMMGVPTPSI